MADSDSFTRGVMYYVAFTVSPFAVRLPYVIHSTAGTLKQDPAGEDHTGCEKPGCAKPGIGNSAP